MIVNIPDRSVTEGVKVSRFEIGNTCPVCGGPRGLNRWQVNHYDGKQVLLVDIWTNPCGHVDLQSSARQEAAQILKEQEELANTG
ncbi:hypothetical protein GCM10028806_33760 [Spirosoma terrae]